VRIKGGAFPAYRIQSSINRKPAGWSGAGSMAGVIYSSEALSGAGFFTEL
jgi:hypothetical protein